MKILLIGEYSRLHLTLAEGFRNLGHTVVVASDGDGYKEYARDVDLTRKSSSVLDTLSTIFKINKHFTKFKDYDVVQVINPCYLTLSVWFNHYYFDKLKKYNKKVFLGAFGDDSYWVKACKENQIFKYSEFFVNNSKVNLSSTKILEDKWLNSSREKLNTYIAQNANGIIACLYEYYKSYEPYYKPKLTYIPLPIHVNDIVFDPIKKIPDKIKFFIGIDRARAEYKGTDLMEKVLDEFAQKYTSQVEVLKAEAVSFHTYHAMMAESHVVLDQLYSHSPSVNPLQAMAQGKIVITGGEPEMYNLMGKVDNRPIINVHPTEKGIWDALEHIVKNKEQLPLLSLQGRQFVEQYHESTKVAKQYLDFWNSCK